MAQRGQVTKTILVGVLLMLTLLVCAVSWIFLDCENRRYPPVAPLYPLSILVKRGIIGGGGAYPLQYEIYTTGDTPHLVRAFYETRTQCSSENGITTCRGSALPFGSYSVFIDYSESGQAGTTYTIEIEWRACAWFD